MHPGNVNTSQPGLVIIVLFLSSLAESNSKEKVIPFLQFNNICSQFLCKNYQPEALRLQLNTISINNIFKITNMNYNTVLYYNK